MFKHINLKVFSVLIAISLWLVVATSDISEMKMYVPVKLKNISEGYVAVTDETLLNIEVTGSNMLLQNISHNDIVIDIDVSNFNVGSKNYRIKDVDIKKPNGIEVVRVEPQNINIKVDKMVDKLVKVVPSFIGEPKEGFKVETVETFPKTVSMQGAESELNNSEFIETLPINLSSRYEGMIYATGMKLGDGIEKTDPEQVDVFINFSEDIVEEVFDEFRIYSENLLDNVTYKVSPEIVKIKVRGRKDRLNEKNINNFIRLTVDLSGIESSGKYLREINKNVNDTVRILSMEPQNVRIEVTE